MTPLCRHQQQKMKSRSLQKESRPHSRQIINHIISLELISKPITLHVCWLIPMFHRSETSGGTMIFIAFSVVLCLHIFSSFRIRKPTSNWLILMNYGEKLEIFVPYLQLWWPMEICSLKTQSCSVFTLAIYLPIPLPS